MAENCVNCKEKVAIRDDVFVNANVGKGVEVDMGKEQRLEGEERVWKELDGDIKARLLHFAATRGRPGDPRGAAVERRLYTDCKDENLGKAGGDLDVERSTEVLEHGTRGSCSVFKRVGEKVVQMFMKGESESGMVSFIARLVPRMSGRCCPPQSGAGE